MTGRTHKETMEIIRDAAKKIGDLFGKSEEGTVSQEGTKGFHVIPKPDAHPTGGTGPKNNDGSGYKAEE